MKKILLLLTLLCAGFAAPTFAQSLCTNITALPYTIDTPGNYCLVGPQVVDMTSGNAITINTSNVVLDCLDFSIRNTTTTRGSTSVAISATNQNRIVVKNCRIDGGFHTGIKASQSNSVPNKNYYLRVLDNYITGPFVYGIWAYGSAIEIVDNRIYDIGGRPNSLAAGIRLGAYTGGGPKFHFVRENLIAGTNSPDNNAYGILSDLSLASLFVQNAVTGSVAANSAYRGYGIRLMGGTYNRITDNHVTGGGTDNETGIQAPDSTTSCFDNYLRIPVPTTGCDASMGNF